MLYYMNTVYILSQKAVILPVRSHFQLPQLQSWNLPRKHLTVKCRNWKRHSRRRRSAPVAKSITRLWNVTQSSRASQRVCPRHRYRSHLRLDRPSSLCQFRRRTLADRWSPLARWRVRAPRVSLVERGWKPIGPCSRIASTIPIDIAACGTTRPGNRAPGRSPAKRTRSRCDGRSSVGAKPSTSSSRSIAPRKRCRTGRRKWPWPVQSPYPPQRPAWIPWHLPLLRWPSKRKHPVLHPFYRCQTRIHCQR